MNKIVLLGLSVCMVTAVSAAQVNMDKAAEHLTQAKAYLEKAKKNKGGFRVKAINSVNRALQQTKKGKKAAVKSNKKKKKESK